MRDRRTATSGARGFTLIELLVVMGMLSVVLAAVYSLYLTSQRSAYTQDEVVEVQQNLRIAMESISRDVRMAGFMIPPDISGTPNVPYSPTVPIGNFGNNTGLPALPGSFVDPAENITDSITINTASAGHVYAYIDNGQTGAAAAFVVDSPESVDAFSQNDFVRVIRPQNKDQVPSGGALYQITGWNRTVPSLTLAWISGADPSATVFNRGDIILRTTNNAPHPNTVEYFVTNNAAVNTCPLQQLCIVRRTNGGPPAGENQVIATNIANLQFEYILNTAPTVETTLVPDLEQMRAVKVSITGRTAATLGLSGTQTETKDRTVSSTILFRNKRVID